MEGRDALSGEGVQTHGLVSQSDVSRPVQGSVTSAANDGNTPAGHGANISGGGASGSAAGQVHSAPDVNNAGTAPNQQVLSTQDLASGVVYTPSRVEMRHEAIPDLLHSHVIPSQPPLIPRDPDHGSVFSSSHGPGPEHRVRHSSSHRPHPRHHYRDRHRSRHSRGGRRSRSTSHSTTNCANTGA